MEHRDVEHIRNFSIVAHVDHGKTTLTDNLLALFGVISHKSAGKVRYLDNTKAEQERQITMKSSSISLTFQKYQIHVLDSPGHVDFSSEVSIAMRMTDGACIVVDAIEGLCIQSLAVLRHAFRQRVSPILLINKIDRLVREWRLSPLDAYDHLRRLIEEINGVVGQLWRERVFERDPDAHVNFDTEDDSNLFFDPLEGNVIFASCKDGWGFRVSDFVDVFAAKLSVDRDQLAPAMWGEFTLSQKSNAQGEKVATVTAIKPGTPDHKRKPLFALCILKSIWTIYKVLGAEKGYDKGKLDRIVNELQIKIPARMANDNQSIIRQIMSSWIPVSIVVLSAVIKHIPNPREAQRKRIHLLWDTLPEEPTFIEHVAQCDRSGPLIAYISKVFTVERGRSVIHKPNEGREVHVEEAVEELDGVPILKQESRPSHSNLVFVAFGRLYSGVLRRGQAVHVLGMGKTRPTATIAKELYRITGMNLEPVDEVRAGYIFGIGGIDHAIHKSATLSSALSCPPFSAPSFGFAPVVRVALEPALVADLPQLVEGMRLLSQADACVQTLVQCTGEHVIVASGELHLERCIQDLRELYAPGLQFDVSPPLVSFRETVSKPYDPQEKMLKIKTSDKKFILGFRVYSMPLPFTRLLEKHATSVLETIAGKSDHLESIQDALKNDPLGLAWWKHLLESDLWCAFPSQKPVNLLFCSVHDDSPNVAICMDQYREGFIKAFTQAMKGGPLCEEPLWGTVVEVSHLEYIWESPLEPGDKVDCIHSIAKATNKAILKGIKDGAPRIVEPKYLVDLQVAVQKMRGCVNVLAKRRGDIFLEEMKEGTDLFLVRAYLPVYESFGFSEQIRGETSGSASVQLAFSHWDMLEDDPYWVPTTEEEIEEFGDNIGAARPSLAKKIMTEVRRKKGMAVEWEVLVKDPEKQQK